MRGIIIFVALIISTMAQRPSYAGTRPIGRPGLASRFQDTAAAETTTPDLSNRIGESGTTAKIPVDARGDSDLVNRLNEWPREHRPFWLLNAEHIEAARNNTNAQIANRNNFQQGDTIPVTPSVPRSPFLPPLDQNSSEEFS